VNSTSHIINSIKLDQIRKGKRNCGSKKIMARTSYISCLLVILSICIASFVECKLGGAPRAVSKGRVTDSRLEPTQRQRAVTEGEVLKRRDVSHDSVELEGDGQEREEGEDGEEGREEKEEAGRVKDEFRRRVTDIKSSRRNTLTKQCLSDVAITAAATAASTKQGTRTTKASTHRGGSIFSTKDKNGNTVLTYYGLMLSGSIARTVAATAVHPLNVVKTLLQTKDGKVPAFKWSVLSRGAGSQFIMSVPHGAFQFVVTEVST